MNKQIIFNGENYTVIFQTIYMKSFFYLICVEGQLKWVNEQYVLATTQELAELEKIFRRKKGVIIYCKDNEVMTVENPDDGFWEYREYFRSYIERLKEKYPFVSLENIIKIVSRVKVVTPKHSNFNKFVREKLRMSESEQECYAANYVHRLNTIIFFQVDDAELDTDFSHEFVHLASCKPNKVCGLTSADGKFFGIEEGVTELIASRLGNRKPIVEYEFQVKFAKLIEMLVGEDFLIACYFNNNMQAIIDKIKEVCNKQLKDIMTLLGLIDLYTRFTFFKVILGARADEKCKDIEIRCINLIKKLLVSKYKLEHSNNDCKPKTLALK